MDTGKWYYARAGQQAGPVDLNTLKSLISAGQLSSADMVWRDGMPQWAPAGHIPDLFPNRAPEPPPLPQAPLAYATPQPRDLGDDAGIRLLIPVGRSAWAIASGYLGLFAVLLLPAPFALIVSIITPSYAGSGLRQFPIE